ncbi:hypothetical protein AB6805_30525 [Chitinophaga sp. RCC_12]|uniref:hypothetical protein n=1 Tax=Chitinophaga sp. RCC_12 TaxID=3239226 RepID=UPI0035261B8E
MKILQKLNRYKYGLKMIKLSAEQEQEIRGVLRGVNVAGICRDLHRKGKIQSPRVQSVWEALRGDRENIDTLTLVVKEARRIKAKKQRQLASL